MRPGESAGTRPSLNVARLASWQIWPVSGAGEASVPPPPWSGRDSGCHQCPAVVSQQSLQGPSGTAWFFKWLYLVTSVMSPRKAVCWGRDTWPNGLGTTLSPLHTLWVGLGALSGVWLGLRYSGKSGLGPLVRAVLLTSHTSRHLSIKSA